MQKVIGALIIVACVLGGYAMAHGDMRVLWQPAEVVIILGAGLGSLVVANPREVLLEMLSQVKGVFVYKRRGEEFQRQLLMLLYQLLEMVEVGGLKVLDEHIEEPEQSELFARYPLILQEKNLMAFIADNFRHMDVEETAHNALLWARYTDAELVTLHDRLVGSIAPAEMLLVMRWMVPFMNPVERMHVLGDMRAKAPPPAFQAVLDTVRPHLTTAEWGKLARALALPAAPGLATA